MEYRRATWFTLWCLVLHNASYLQERECQRELRPDSFVVMYDNQNRPFFTMTHVEVSKNHQGGMRSLMKEISSGAELSRIYTNHSVYATCITLLSKANVPSRHNDNQWAQEQKFFTAFQPKAITVPILRMFISCISW